MDSVDGNAQAGGLVHDDLGAGPVEPQHIAVDDLAGDDKAGQSGRFVDGHLGDRGLEGRLHLAGELYLHRAGQGLAVVAQRPTYRHAKPETILPAQPSSGSSGSEFRYACRSVVFSARMSSAPALSRPLAELRMK